MPVTASAPGKLVLLGEYAVLEGAPALVLAVNRRACVTLTETTDDYSVISAPGLGIDRAACRVHTGGQVEWLAEPQVSNRLHLVTAVLESFAASEAVPRFHIELDTECFFLDVQGEHLKLGLGSSAALTVALAGGLCTAQDCAVPNVSSLIELHRRVQAGRGSGLDIAAALNGGLLVYRLNADAPDFSRVYLPPALQWCCVWSGKPASTGDFLQTLAAWREREPQQYNDCMARLMDVANAGVAAVRRGDAGAFMDAVCEYTGRLAKLGVASGVDIVCREHRDIATVAAACGIAYKSCGAGGGDCGIALSTDDGKLADFRRQITQAGFRTLDLTVDPHGLEAHITNQQQ